MIYKKVPAISDGFIEKIIAYNSPFNDEIYTMFQRHLALHPYNSIEGENGTERKRSLFQLCKLYYVLLEKKREDKDYKAYLETIEELLVDRGLITDHKAGFPMDQFKNRSIERLVVEAIKEVKPNDEVYIPQKGPGQDFGIDFIWNGMKVDVKTSKTNDFLNPNSTLGKFKEKALTDPTKQTDYILWTGNMIDKGYICLVGVEKWTKIKEDALAQRGWYTYDYKKFNLKMYAKKLRDFDSKEFGTRFLGKISEGEKNKIMAAYQGVSNY